MLLTPLIYTPIPIYRWACDEWAEARKLFIESLGQRSQNWSSNALVVRPSVGGDMGNISNISSINNMGNISSVNMSVQTPVVHSLFPTSPFMKSNLNTAATNTPLQSSLPTSSSINTKNITTTLQISPLFQKQANIIKELMICTYNNENKPLQNDSIRPCKELSKVTMIPNNINNPNQVDSDNLNKSDLLGFQNILELLGEIVGETNDIPHPAGYFSTICFNPTDVAVNALLEKKRIITHHIIKFLQEQIWKDWDSVVQEAIRQVCSDGLCLVFHT